MTRDACVLPDEFVMLQTIMAHINGPQGLLNALFLTHVDESCNPKDNLAS